MDITISHYKEIEIFLLIISPLSNACLLLGVLFRYYWYLYYWFQLEFFLLLNTQESHFVLSLHKRQTCSDCFAFENSSTTISNVLVMGLLRDHASLLKVALPFCLNSGVYAIVFISFPETKKRQPKLIDCPWLKFMTDSSTYNKTLLNRTPPFYVLNIV